MEPTLEWDKPMTSAQASKYHMTSGFVAIELLRVTERDNAKLKKRIAELGQQIEQGDSENLSLRKRIAELTRERDDYKRHADDRFLMKQRAEKAEAACVSLLIEAKKRLRQAWEDGFDAENVIELDHCDAVHNQFDGEGGTALLERMRMLEQQFATARAGLEKAYRHGIDGVYQSAFIAINETLAKLAQKKETP